MAECHLPDTTDRYTQSFKMNDWFYVTKHYTVHTGSAACELSDDQMPGCHHQLADWRIVV